MVPGLIWDACALLNLAASGRSEEILLSLECPCYVAKKVRVEEVIYLRPLPEENPVVTKHLIDMTPLVMSGHIKDVEPTEEELETFVNLAERLDDGEAMTLAVAQHRSLSIVSDERLVLKIAPVLSSPVDVITTAAFVRLWAERGGVEQEIVSQVKRRIEIQARFRPHRLDPCYAWWCGEHTAVAG